MYARMHRNAASKAVSLTEHATYKPSETACYESGNWFLLSVRLDSARVCPDFYPLSAESQGLICYTNLGIDVWTFQNCSRVTVQHSNFYL